MDRKFVIIERGSYGDETDRYEVEGDMQDALDKLAAVADEYPSYKHTLFEEIPVDIVREGEDDVITAKSGNVIVRTSAK